MADIRHSTDGRWDVSTRNYRLTVFSTLSGCAPSAAPWSEGLNIWLTRPNLSQDPDLAILWILDLCKWRSTYFVECEAEMRYASPAP